MRDEESVKDRKTRELAAYLIDEYKKSNPNGGVRKFKLNRSGHSKSIISSACIMLHSVGYKATFDAKTISVYMER